MRIVDNKNKNIALKSLTVALYSSLAFSSTPDWVLCSDPFFSSSYIEGADLYKGTVSHEVNNDSKDMYKPVVISDSISGTQYPVLKDIKLLKSIVTLKDVSELEENWNGYGGHPISSSIIKFALHMLLILDVQPNIFPTGRRSLQFEYRKTDNSYLEFEIFEDKVKMLMIPNNDFGKAEMQTLDFEDHTLEQFIIEKVRVFNGSNC